MNENVIVSNGKEVYYGTIEYDSPVDEPPVIVANGRHWYRETWEKLGYTIEYEDEVFEIERFPLDTYYVTERSPATLTQTVTAYSPLGAVLGRFTVTDEMLVLFERHHNVRVPGPRNDRPGPQERPNLRSGDSSPRRQIEGN